MYIGAVYCFVGNEKNFKAIGNLIGGQQKLHRIRVVSVICGNKLEDKQRKFRQAKEGGKRRLVSWQTKIFIQ